MNQKGVKTAFLLGPNYAAGKDMLAGVASTFKGTIVGQELTKWPDQLDFSVELAKARGAKPDAIFAFYPGASGAQFLIQYLQSGLKDQIPLCTAFTIDEITLPRQKEAAVGIPGAQEWVNDLPNEQNKRFVADYRKKHPGLSPTFYGAQTYDAAMLINSAVVATKGDLSDKEAVRKAMEKADFDSVRGKFRFGNNHVPIQNFYLQEAIKDRDGYVLKTVATIVEDSQDRFHGQCPMKYKDGSTASPSALTRSSSDVTLIGGHVAYWTQRLLRADRKCVADDEHPDHQRRIDRRPPNLRIEGASSACTKKVENRSNRSNWVIVRNGLIKTKRIEKLTLVVIEPPIIDRLHGSGSQSDKIIVQQGRQRLLQQNPPLVDMLPPWPPDLLS